MPRRTEKMPLGPHVPEWVALQRELKLLCAQTASDNACVLDAWGNVWCAACPNLGPAQRQKIKGWSPGEPPTK
jgi:hypothetical protein